MTSGSFAVPPERVVIRPPNWLGDAVLALPAIAAMRRHFASSHVTVAATPGVAALFREDTSVHQDRVIDLPVSTRDAIAMLTGGGFDLGLLLPNSFRSAWQFQRAGIRHRWGYPTAGRSLLLTRRARKTPSKGTRHQADYYRDLARGLDIPCDAAEPPVISPKPPSVERANALLAQVGIGPGEPFVCFAPGAAYGSAKQWPPDRVAELAARLVRSRGLACVLVGASHDREAARAIESWLRSNAREAADRVVSLVGRTSLGALIGVTARSAAFVSNDSGAMHLAAALDRPVIAIFGPTDERATHPVGNHTVLTEPVFCRPCMLRDCPIDHRCMKRISTDRAYAAIEARLDVMAAR